MKLQNKHVLVGVCSSVAACKSAILIRELRRSGAEVRVVMTHSAQAFVTPLLLQSLSGHPVATELFDGDGDSGMKHIDFARWADAVVIAPASANLLAKLAHGLADDLLSTVCLATSAPVMTAPAMNRQMWAHPATCANLAILRGRNIVIQGPVFGDQACGDEGEGRMTEPAEIVSGLEAFFGRRPLSDLRVVVTAGPTRETLDPVRAITSRSSGRMGFAMAQAAREAGAEVTLIAGPVSLPTPGSVARMDVASAAEMLDAVRRVDDMDMFISCAAVSDYRPAHVQSEKIKSSEESLTLQLVRNPDILGEVAQRQPRPFLVGFAAETSRVEANAKAKLMQKNLDVIVANRVGDDSAYGFDSEENIVTAYWHGGHAHYGPAAKTELGRRLMECITELYEQTSQEREHGNTA